MGPIGLESISGLFRVLPFVVGRRINDLLNLVKVARYAPFAPTTLPLEIIVEIMKQLDWCSLLNIRQTCNLLNDITRVRAVWISQYHQYVAQRMQLTRLEEPLQSYSALELEQWVLVRRSADIGWRCENMKYRRNRWIKRWNSSTGYLVPGGRWFLVGGEDGSMTTYDLDATIITGTPLIPRDAQDEPVRYIAIDIDLSKQSPNRTFNMAVLACMQYTSSNPLNINFSRVTLAGHSTEAQLTADHLCSIQAHDPGYTRGIAMRRNIFARIHQRQNSSYIEVFDWKLSTSSLHCKAIIFPGVMIDGIRLLPGDRLLAFSEEHMMIYSFAILEGVEFTPPTFAPHITEPSWKLPFAGTRTDRGALSEGFSNETATYFVVKARNIHGLIIPHNEDEAPTFHLLVELDSSGCPTCAIGFERAFIQHEDRSIARLNFSWEAAGENENNHGALVFREYPTTCNGAQIPQLDEETGRIVQVLRDGFRVIDTALIYTESDELQEDLYFSL